MSKRILLILSHSIEEYDQLRLLSGLGYEVFSLGGYINPHAPHDPKRPALPDVEHFADLQGVVDGLGVEDNIGTAASNIPEEIFDWLGDDGIIIAHHYLESRIFPQWTNRAFRDWRTRGGRVVWRTVGQSTHDNEKNAQPYRNDGLEIVRYSPNEIHIPNFAGEDALIRFYKDPDEWMGWHGTGEFVTNVTQDLVRRDPWTNAGFFFDAVQGLPLKIVGDGSDDPLLWELTKNQTGLGVLPLKEMQELLQDARCYLYCGTQPASYTLGLIEALMTGVPVVSIHHGYMRIFDPYGQQLFEGDTLAPLNAASPEEAHDLLEVFLRDHDMAKQISQHQRHRAIFEFGIKNVGDAWARFLG